MNTPTTGGHSRSARTRGDGRVYPLHHAPDALKLLGFSRGNALVRCLIAAQPWRSQGLLARSAGFENRLRIVLEAGEQQVVLPDPVDAEILAGKAFALEAGFLQQPDRRDIRGDAR